VKRVYTCHWPGCGTAIPAAHWACQAHWWKIPLGLRNILSRAWQTLRAVRAQPAGAETARAALLEYRAAEQSILTWVKEQST
jgi:hypothetical protein